MEVDVAAAAVVCGEMEHDAHPVDRALGRAGAAQVVLDELELARVQVRRDVLEPPAGEVVHDSNLRVARDKLVDEGGADERRATRHESGTSAPVEPSLHSAGA